MTCDTSSSGCGFEKLESLSDDSITEISENWNRFCSTSEALLKSSGDFSFGDEFVMRAKNLCNHGLAALVEQHFLRRIEEIFERNGARRFWSYFEPYSNAAPSETNKDPVPVINIDELLSSYREVLFYGSSLLFGTLFVYRVLAAAAKRAGQEDEGSNATAENGVDNKKDLLMPDLCVICLEQEYNSVFVPCGHMCCCMTCSSHLTNCPLCRRRIEQVVKTFRH